MSKQTLTTKKLITVAVVLVALCVAAYFTVSLIKSKSEETSKKASELAFYKKKQQDALANEKSGDRVEDFVQKIQSYFVGKNDVVPFLETLEAEAKNHNVELTIKNVEERPYNIEVENDTKEYMVLRLETKSSWQNMMYFIAYLENLPYIISVKTANAASFIEGGGDAEVITGWRGTFEMTVVKQK